LHAAKARQALTEEWGGEAQYRANIEAIRDFLDDGERISPELAGMIQRARLENGMRLINTPEFARMLANLSRSTGEGRIDDAEEFNELNNLLQSNVDEFKHGRWKGTDQSPGDRMLSLERRYSGQARADVSVGEPMGNEEAQLDALMRTDIEQYRYRNWRNSGVTPSDRALQLARRRAGG
jgi:hypothetical protein